MRGKIFAGIAFVIACSASTLHADDSLDNPAYASWSKFKPGTSIVLKGVSNSKEITITETLVEVKADKCVIEMASKIGEHEAKHNRDVLKTVTDPDVIKKFRDETAHGVDETITTPAGTFKCLHYSSKTEEGGTMDVWTSQDVPGMDVKSVHDEPTLKVKSTTELQSIDKK